MRVSGIPYIQGRNDYDDADSRKFAIAIHNTSNNASDEAEASYATRRTDGVSAHFYVDADSVIQSLDTDSKAGHAGSRIGNENAIAIEITGGNGMSREWWLSNVAWERLGYVCAVLCRAYGIAVRRASVAEMRSNPNVKAFYGHDDMRLAWGGTDHTDPGPNFPWDRLFSAVNAALSGTADAGDSEMDAVQAQQLTNVHQLLQALVRLQPVANGVVIQGYSDAAERAALPSVTLIEDLIRDVADIKTTVGSTYTGVGVTAADLRAAVVAALQSPEGKAAIKAAVKAQLDDDPST